MNDDAAALAAALRRLIDAATDYSPREDHDWRCEYRTAEAGWHEGDPPVIRCECGFDEMVTAAQDADRILAALHAHPPAPDEDTAQRVWAALGADPAFREGMARAAEQRAAGEFTPHKHLSAPPAPLPLDAAWAEAEAALPEGWALSLMPDIIEADRYDASASPRDPFVKNRPTVADTGPTPAAALRALAAKLRESGE